MGQSGHCCRAIDLEHRNAEFVQNETYELFINDSWANEGDSYEDTKSIIPSILHTLVVGNLNSSFHGDNCKMIL